MVYIHALIALIPIIKQLMDLFISTPEEKRKNFILELHSAMEKATKEKDPSDLSKLINSKLR